MAGKARLREQERPKAMKALDYERKMLHSTAMALAQGKATDSLMHNALVESFLIHARLLIEFLYGKRTKPDDIRPEDWLGPGKWEKIRPRKGELLDDTHLCAHKFLVHLTTTRLDRKKEWGHIAILDEINTRLDEFLKQVQTSRRE